MRTLIYVPIVHSDVDLGSMADEVRLRFQAAFGAEQWKRRLASVDAMWDGLRNKLFALSLPWRRTRLYQDGLPACGKEPDIVRDLAAKGSRNHRLLGELMERGATLMGTEDPDLLLAEYRRVQRLAELGPESAKGPVVVDLVRYGESLLARRDAFIASRIDKTLADDETGILFLGLLHRVDELLDGKLDVRHLIHNLPFGAHAWLKWKLTEGDHGD